MHRAILIREPAAQISANSLGFCTYTPSHCCNSLTLAVSAVAKSPRICTFHSYLNSCIFNASTARRAFVSPKSFGLCRYKNRGRGYPPPHVAVSIEDTGGPAGRMLYFFGEGE